MVGMMMMMINDDDGDGDGGNEYVAVIERGVASLAKITSRFSYI